MNSWSYFSQCIFWSHRTTPNLGIIKKKQLIMCQVDTGQRPLLSMFSHPFFICLNQRDEKKIQSKLMHSKICIKYSLCDLNVLLPCMLVLTLRYLRYFLLALNDHRSVTHMVQVYNCYTAQWCIEPRHETLRSFCCSTIVWGCHVCQIAFLKIHMIIIIKHEIHLNN